MGREQRTLATIFREHAGGRRVAPPDKLVMRAQVPSVLDHVRGGGAMGTGMHELGSVGVRAAGSGQLRHTGRLLVSYQGGSSSADSVRVSIKVPSPVGIEQDVVILPSVGSDQSAPAVVPLQLSPASAAHLPWSNTLTVTATFTAANNEPLAQSIDMPLPLCLFASLVPPVKNAGSVGVDAAAGGLLQGSGRQHWAAGRGTAHLEQ